MTFVLHNQTAQPVEIHLEDGVLVLSAHGSAEIDAAARSSPQVEVLARTHQVSISQVALPAAAPAPPAAVAPKRRKTEPAPPAKRK